MKTAGIARRGLLECPVHSLPRHKAPATYTGCHNIGRTHHTAHCRAPPPTPTLPTAPPLLIDRLLPASPPWLLPALPVLI